MIVRDALLAYAHYLTIIALGSLIVAELLIFRSVMQASAYARLRGIDAGYGIAAVLVILTGLGRMFGGVKGAEYYYTNPIFWTKIALFLIVGLLSIPPTISYLRWQNRVAADGSLTLAESETARTRIYLITELLVFACIPLFATLMARGVGH